MFFYRRLFMQQYRLHSIATVRNKVKTAIRRLPNEIKELLKTLPKQLSKSTDNPQYLYILSKSLSAIVIKHLSTDLRNEDAFVFELNPGPGIVTQGILEAGIKKLRVFESNVIFSQQLQQLTDKYNKKLELYKEDLFDINRLTAKYKHNLSNLSDHILKDVPSKTWVEESPLKIFAVIPHTRIAFIRHIIRQYAYFQSFFHVGRVEFLFFMPNNEFMIMTAQPGDKYQKYRSISVLYQVFFTIEILHKEPETSFFPQSKNKNVSADEQTYMHLVRLTPRRNLLDVIPPELLHEFLIFVRHTFARRTRLVVEMFEDWISGSTKRLKNEGVHSKLQFGQLKPHQVLTLFMYLTTWPEYESCVFKNIVNSLERNEDFTLAADISNDE